MNTDFNYCFGYELGGGLEDQPQMCQQCKRYLEVAKPVDKFRWVLPRYNEVDEDCEFYIPINSEKPKTDYDTETI